METETGRRSASGGGPVTSSPIRPEGEDGPVPTRGPTLEGLPAVRPDQRLFSGDSRPDLPERPAQSERFPVKTGFQRSAGPPPAATGADGLRRRFTTPRDFQPIPSIAERGHTGPASLPGTTPTSSLSWGVLRHASAKTPRFDRLSAPPAVGSFSPRPVTSP